MVGANARSGAASASGSSSCWASRARRAVVMPGSCWANVCRDCSRSVVGNARRASKCSASRAKLSGECSCDGSGDAARGCCGSWDMGFGSLLWDAGRWRGRGARDLPLPAVSRAGCGSAGLGSLPEAMRKAAVQPANNSCSNAGARLPWRSGDRSGCRIDNQLFRCGRSDTRSLRRSRGIRW